VSADLAALSNASAGGTSTTDYEEVGYDAGSCLVSQRNRAGRTTTLTVTT
jgi:hypothetical protein